MYTFLCSALGAKNKAQTQAVAMKLHNTILKNKFKDFRPHKPTRMDAVLSQSQFQSISQTQWWN